MKIEAFLLCWNELDIMPFVIKHYQKFCDKITIYDNYSTDGSDKLAESMGCEVIKFGTMFFDDGENMKVKNECWKGSQSDFVIVADFDEVVHFGKITALSAQFSGVTIFNTMGWQVMSDRMPVEDLNEFTIGYRFDNYSKKVIFDPKKITDMAYNPGAHKCDPKGEVKYYYREIPLLHYKHIGGVQRTIDRYKILQKRLSKNNRKNGWGIHYNRTPASLREEWNERMAKSKPLI